MKNNKIRDRHQIMMISSVHVWFDTRIFFKEAMSLANNGFEVDFSAIEAENKQTDIPNQENLTVNILPRKSRLSRWHYWRKFYQQFMNSNAYFLHIQDPELLIVAYFVKKKLGDKVQIIYDMHEHLPAAIKTKTWIPKFMRERFSRIVSSVEKKLMKSCDSTLFAELSYKDNYQDMELDSVDILNYPQYQPDEFTLSHSADNIAFTLVYVGALIEQRGLYEMIDLIDELVNKRKVIVQLNLVGQINENPDRLKEYIAQRNLNDFINLLGRKPYSQIWKIYHESDLGLCLLQPTPNNLNSQSTKLFEYMAAGLPFIASDFPAFHRICEEFKCGIDFDPTNSELMADWIVEFMADEALRIQMGQQGIKAFQEHYNWQIEEKKLIQLYEDKVNKDD
ncbi:glycosyltransferase [Lactobacillus sp. YT155]|uniref:glycosyltransferase n=1 Tax=Lactobacillus sp. YT155 TaxID=3060955 RepID=UPI00265F7204|nr:glycosyltransferase [Lactobacillus sp. YT155]MDO1604835.1 glycosyltransferase [Lactobacillus sp. YT155]